MNFSIRLKSPVSSVLIGQQKISTSFTVQGAGGQHISDVVASTSHSTDAVVLAVGPEGGWVDYEVQMFKENGFIQVSSDQLTLVICCIRRIILPRYIGIVLSHYKDPVINQPVLQGMSSGYAVAQVKDIGYFGYSPENLRDF